jgi:hypothetical protein
MSATTPKRKRRTVLWLYAEDYEYLSAVAETDLDTKNASMHRLVKALRTAGIQSFFLLESVLPNISVPGSEDPDTPK